MELNKEQRGQNREIRPAVKALNYNENGPRRHRVKLSAAFVAALPKAGGAWIKRASNSMRRCGVKL